MALFPSGFTKEDALAYYDAVAPYILPHLRNRPVSFRRYLNDVRGEAFWEKDAPSFTPKWVKRFPVPRREGGAPIEYIVINNKRTLLWVVSVGGIELHPFLHLIPKIDIATHAVFDLDPGEGAGISEAARVALLLRDALTAVGLQSFAKLSGSKGVQVYVPLNSGAPHDAVETFARVIAAELARAHPKLVVAKMAKALRRGKVFIDWSQNADYKTTVAVYSLRGKRDTPFVSMPVEWRELEKARKLDFAPDAALARLEKKGDLFAPVLKIRQKLPRMAARRDRRAARPATPVATKNANGAIPKAGSQSGRRLFVITKTEMGNELWMEMRGKFRRWILRPDRAGGKNLIAMPAGEFAIDKAYYRGEVPDEWKGRVELEDRGAYELVGGSVESERLELWFNGRLLSGAWTLQKIERGKQHRSWRLAPG